MRTNWVCTKPLCGIQFRTEGKNLTDKRSGKHKNFAALSVRCSHIRCSCHQQAVIRETTSTKARLCRGWHRLAGLEYPYSTFSSINWSSPPCLGIAGQSLHSLQSITCCPIYNIVLIRTYQRLLICIPLLGHPCHRIPFMHFLIALPC